MKHRKNAVYTGKSTRARNIRGIVYRYVVDAFYAELNKRLLPENEIEIIPPEQVKPAHRAQDQAYIMADYCVRKIAPEVMSPFRWGDELMPRLRALAPIVDAETANAAYDAASPVYDIIYPDNDSDMDAAGYYYSGDYRGVSALINYDSAAAGIATTNAAQTARSAANTEADDARDVYNAERSAAFGAARCVYYALLACIEIGDEAAYNRIIALTNEMLESL